MSSQVTPVSERIHIGFFGCSNAGKSSLVNAVTGQSMAIVSDIRGTTTDPVRKSMELLPLGPVVIIDTPGIDDETGLGTLRVQRTREILNETDVAVLVIDGVKGLRPADKELLQEIRNREIPYLLLWNKSDLPEAASPKEKALPVSAATGFNIEQLKKLLSKILPTKSEQTLVGDLVSPGDLVVLVCPIDEAAPKGRLILPQQLTLREILDLNATVVVCRETELQQTLDRLRESPKIVITDSQAFQKVSRIVPESMPLTSFSILMARYKGFLETAAAGVEAVRKLEDGDIVLMAEGCTHHRQCNDIGTVKIPNWLRNYTGKMLEFKTCSGREFPEDLSSYKLVIHCGGCMLTDTVVKNRMTVAIRQGIPFTNYGMVLAQMSGILERSLRPLKIHL